MRVHSRPSGPTITESHAMRPSVRALRPLAVVVATVAATLAATVLAPASPTGAASGDAWSVPTRAWVTISGHGYGHGHGMSQYGAEGAARRGLTFRQIADFYYPGTTWGESRGRVSVLIGADTTDDLVVLARPGLTLRDGAAGPVGLPDNGATRWRIRVTRTGRDEVGYLTGAWHRWALLEGQGELAAAGAPVSLVTPSGVHAYRGRLRAVAPTPGSSARDTVNDLSLEGYLRGVVPLEMPALWSPEAVRAQAVAARTYAAYGRAHPRTARYQLCDTTACQVYGGYDAEHPASDDAVRATRHRVLLSGGGPAFTQFASSSGGWTAAGAVPYLDAHADPYDDWAGNPVHDWSVRVQDTLLERAWPALGNLRRIRVTARDGNGDWGGRVRSLTLVGSSHRVVVSGDTFRARLGLRSTWFTFRTAPR
jgi:SpoIID/LytB domain protein